MQPEAQAMIGRFPMDEEADLDISEMPLSTNVSLVAIKTLEITVAEH